MRVTVLLLLLLVVAPGAAFAGDVRGHLDTGDLPAYLRDRGEGIPLSMFATFIQDGQLLVYPFVEFYRDANYEYKPEELGYKGESDHRGDFEAFEALLFIGYGVSDRLAVELEGAITQAELERSADDRSGVPAEIEKSGIGDVEGQLRWRWTNETARRPEIFSYFETVAPTQREGSLIGTSDWEFKLGTGVIRGFSFGTFALRGSLAYDRAAGAVDVGEAAIEYLKRLSPSWRVYAGIEGAQDEWAAITEAQWHLTPTVFLKVNNGFGITSKAPGWAPELGVVFGF
jgi:hypothetical protein